MNYISADKIFYHPEKIAQKGFSPVTAEVFLTNNCNNSCFYCSQKQKSHNDVHPAELNKEMILKTFDLLQELGVKSVVFSGGGEPTLHESLPNIMETYEGIFDFGLITNGVKIPYIYRLHDPKWIRVSIDAADSETYKKIRGTDNFDRVAANIHALLETKKENNLDTVIGLHVVVNEYNYDQLPEIADFVTQNFPDINYLQIRAYEKLVFNKAYTLEKWKVINESLELLKNYDKVMLSNKWDMVRENKFMFSACHASKYMLNISAEGNISTCCHMSENSKYIICNLKDFNTVEEFKAIHDKKIASFVNKGFDYNFCPIACRGFGINRAIESFDTRQHINFI